jgi:hypothetical protein
MENAVPLNLSNTEALGRTYAAARMMAGLDQAGLAHSAGLSNVERGKDSKEVTLKHIRRALVREGVSLAFSRSNGQACVMICFAADEGDED